MKGETNVGQMKPYVCGPGKVTSGGKTYDTSKGAKGMRATYQETGKQGKSSK